ncbi:hypothetical protein ACFZDG_27850 [Kitasatospora xanthocidica]|uniref:hypothetical protein n=1 Tax=Kitasatospora xanthocidica TaxID=83382 RepID=UPI0036EC1B12
MAHPRPSRRPLLQPGAALAAPALTGGCSSDGGGRERPGPGTPGSGAAAPGSPAAGRWARPAESAPHTRTFMAWPALEEVWGDQPSGVPELMVDDLA